MTNLESMREEMSIAPQIDQELDRFCLQIAIEGENPQLRFSNKLEFLLLTLKNKPMELPRAFHVVFRIEFSRIVKSTRQRWLLIH